MNMFMDILLLGVSKYVQACPSLLYKKHENVTKPI